MEKGKRGTKSEVNRRAKGDRKGTALTSLTLGSLYTCFAVLLKIVNSLASSFACTTYQKLLRGKTFANLRIYAVPQKFSPRIFWGVAHMRMRYVNGHTHADCSTKVFLAKSSFLPICESFLPQEFPTIWYTLFSKSFVHHGPWFCLLASV